MISLNFKIPSLANNSSVIYSLYVIVPMIIFEDIYIKRDTYEIFRLLMSNTRDVLDTFPNLVET